MTEAAKLTTDHFVTAGLDRLEPHWDDLAGNRVLRDAHVRQREIVDHILRRKLDDDRSIDRHVQFVQHDDVVLSCRIARIETEGVRIGQERDIAFTKLTIRPRQMEGPVKLLPDGVYENRILVVRKMIHSRRPERDRESEEQDGFNQNDRKFQMGRNAALHAFVICDRISAFPETQEYVNEEGRPADKERTHEPMAELDDVIDLVAMLRSIRRQADQLVDEGEPSHIDPSLRRLVPDAARAACWHAARDGN